jgi:hypothetical protein
MSMDKAAAEKIRQAFVYGMKCARPIERFMSTPTEYYEWIEGEWGKSGFEALTTPPAKPPETVGVTENRYRLALESIAKNSCCDSCQEAKKVAQNALGYPEALVLQESLTTEPANRCQCLISKGYFGQTDCMDCGLPSHKGVLSQPARLLEAAQVPPEGKEAAGLVRTMYAMLKTEEQFGLIIPMTSKGWMASAEIWIKSLHEADATERKPAEPLHDNGIWVNHLEGIPDPRYHFKTKKEAEEFNISVGTKRIRPIRYIPLEGRLLEAAKAVLNWYSDYEGMLSPMETMREVVEAIEKWESNG